MKICDVVLNSIWYDPRVRKQIAQYNAADDVELCCVGMKCPRYDAEKVLQIPCKTDIVQIDSSLDGKQKSVFKKLQREKAKNFAVRDAIIAANPDVIHANDLNALIPAYMAKKKLGCKLIYDSHELNTENYLTAKRPLFLSFMRRVEKFLTKRVDLMVCVSHAAAQYFATEYKIKTPMVVTNCALKSEIVEADAKNAKFEVLNHGQFYEGRGYELMVKSAEFLKDVPDVAVAMRGFGRLEATLHEMAQGCDNVIFYPPVRVENLIPEASKSMVGVAITEPRCLNFKYSVSNKLFEYAAAGLPVIMSDIPEHKYLNEKYNFGIVLDKTAPECFADAVKKLYFDKDFYNLCAENAKKLSMQVNWETEFEKILSAERKMTSK